MKLPTCNTSYVLSDWCVWIAGMQCGRSSSIEKFNATTNLSYAGGQQEEDLSGASRPHLLRTRHSYSTYPLCPTHRQRPRWRRPKPRSLPRYVGTIARLQIKVFVVISSNPVASTLYTYSNRMVSCCSKFSRWQKQWCETSGKRAWRFTGCICNWFCNWLLWWWWRWLAIVWLDCWWFAARPVLFCIMPRTVAPSEADRSKPWEVRLSKNSVVINTIMMLITTIIIIQIINFIQSFQCHRGLVFLTSLTYVLIFRHPIRISTGCCGRHQNNNEITGVRFLMCACIIQRLYRNIIMSYSLRIQLHITQQQLWILTGVK